MLGVVPNIKPIATSLHAVSTWSVIPNVDSTVIVTVKGFPSHPSSLTGTTV